MVPSDTQGEPTVDSLPQAAVSDLRSRFEKLSDTSVAPTPSIPSGSYGYLSPDPARPRALSNLNKPNGSNACLGTGGSGGAGGGGGGANHLRTSSSSSDLRHSSLSKRPPPPPPSRGSPSPHASPLLRPVPAPIPISSVSMPNIFDLGPVSVSPSQKSTLLSRKPPPPPPSQLGQAESDVATPSGSVASLINRFGASTPALSASPSRPSVLASSPMPISPRALDFPRSPRHSQLSANPPDIKLHSPFSDSESDTEEGTSSSSHGRPPPPLPSRGTGVRMNGSGVNGHQPLQHRRELSSSPERSPNPPTRPTIVPPRPPPRHLAGLSPSSAESSSSSSTPTTQQPPPLPRRRPTTPDYQPSHPNLPPRPPVRQPSLPELETPERSSTAPSAVPADRKQLGTSKLPPPPTRTIALGDKLPPPRRPPSPSSDESEEEEEPRNKLLDSMPDTSRSSRRPPFISVHEYPETRIHVPSHSGVVAVSGHIVVAAHSHHLKVFDLSVLDTPIWDIDLKDVLDWKVKEMKVTSAEFRPAMREEDRGCFVWLGTKDGHLLEFDVRTGSLAGVRPSAHTHTVTHIFRWGKTMVSMDDNGKVLVFSPEDSSGSGSGSGDDLRLASAHPRVQRIADKQEFAKMLGGKLWTSARLEAGGAGTSSRGPIVKVYDILVPGSSGKSLLPTEHVGNVTCGTILPSQPEYVYLGHEGGFISIWSIVTDDGIPACVEVMKVGSSDVLCLEGVNERLWAGGRKGMIAAFDVTSRPWVLTNNWMAHEGLPVTKLAVDPWSIEKLGRLCVVSVGRDEKLRFWDGLLAENWIGQEILKREDEFSNFRDLNVLIVSWNVDAAKPDALSGSPDNVSFLDTVLHTVDSPDIISFGFQELIDLESRKMAAKSVLLGGKKKTSDGSISEKVTSSYKKWYDKLVLAVRLAMPPETPYTVIHTENLVGLFSCIFVKNTERFSLKDVAITTIKRGMGGRYGNKGGIVARFIIDDTSICFINCHLAAGHHHVRQRNADVAAMLEEKAVFPGTEGSNQEPLAYVGGGDGSMVLDHEIVFFSGDMNYRIDQRRDAVAAAVRANDYEYLIAHDQLSREMKFNRAFRLRPFTEGPLTFPPTYKYDRRSDEYDSSEKRRIPAWCDRVLWRSRDPGRVEELHYQRYEANVSDHRPISAGFRMTVKSVSREARARVKAEMRSLWDVQEQNLLIAARDFYVMQAAI